MLMRKNVVDGDRGTKARTGMFITPNSLHQIGYLDNKRLPIRFGCG